MAPILNRGLMAAAIAASLTLNTSDMRSANPSSSVSSSAYPSQAFSHAWSMGVAKVRIAFSCPYASACWRYSSMSVLVLGFSMMLVIGSSFCFMWTYSV